MFWNLLDTATGTTTETTAATGNWWDPFVMPAMIILIVAAAAVFFFLNRRSQKKREKEMQGMLDAIQPGNKVKTIGGICGIVVEVCPDDNTFVLETGTEASGKSYLKFDKQAVYQTDAVPKKEEPKKVDAPVEEKDAPVEEKVDAPVEETEAPAEEAVQEEKPKKKNKKKK